MANGGRGQMNPARVSASDTKPEQIAVPACWMQSWAPVRQ